MENLIERIRQHDAAALAEYVESNKQKLLGALERKVGSGLRRKLDLEDILQETLARALKDLASMDFGEQDPSGWLYQVMDRQIVDLHRFHFGAQKRDAAREVSADAPMSSEGNAFADMLIASMTSPSAAVSRDIRLQRVYQAMSTLSEEMQQAIRLRYLENRSSQEIAKTLGKSDVATRVLLSRAIKKLQSAFGES